MMFLVIWLAIATNVAANTRIDISSDMKDADDVLHIHMVPHCHADVGWLKTVDQYYCKVYKSHSIYNQTVGANNSLANAGVQYTLDTVVQALAKDPARRFIWVEMAFFTRWWSDQKESNRQLVRELVSNKQLVFVNGGWVMHDEATTQPADLIDQMERGHWWIVQEFGVEARPRIAWHIDPFGHSAAHPGFFAAMGMDGFFFARIHYQDYANRVAKGELEMLWESSPSLGKNGSLFTGVLFAHYSAPKGFNFDILSDDPPIPPATDDWIGVGSMKERADAFAQNIQSRHATFRTNHIMLTMGDDFQYQSAHHNFLNMDRLMQYINEHPAYNMHVFYSTPNEYVDAVHATNLKWKVKTDDFFPYASEAHAAWTGFFTSRPALKRYSDVSNNWLRSVEKFAVLARQDARFDWNKALIKMKTGIDATAILQHHDAVTGTERQHVACDYALRLYLGNNDVDQVGASALGCLMTDNATVGPLPCHQSNESVCSWSNAYFLDHDRVPIVVINSEAQVYHQQPVSVLVPSDQVCVYAHDNSTGIDAQVNDVFVTSATQKSHLPYRLWWLADVEPLGYTTYYVAREKCSTTIRGVVKQPVQLNNGILSVDFVGGRMVSATLLDTQLSVKSAQDYRWYNSSNGQRITSNAYIFRPNGTFSYPFVNPADDISAVLITGPIVQEVRQEWAANLSVALRLFKGFDALQVDSAVGPLWFEDGLGREVIMRWTTDIANDDVWYTDANGMEMQRRQRNFQSTWTWNVTESIAENYYPVTQSIHIQDDKHVLVVVTDRPEGGSSPKNGVVDVMLHRRIQAPDGWGKPLNETWGGIIKTQHWLRCSEAQDAPRWRALVQPTLVPLWMNPISSPLVHPSFKGMYPLPFSLSLMALRSLEDGSVLIRLQHKYPVSEGGVPVDLALDQLFVNVQVVEAVEWTLTASAPLDQVHRLVWNEEYYAGPDEKSSMVVRMLPLQIRTWLLKIE